MAGKRILLQRFLSLCCQRVKSPPHIGYTSSQPDPRVARHRDVSVRRAPPNVCVFVALVSTMGSGHLRALYGGKAEEAALAG